MDGWNGLLADTKAYFTWSTVVRSDLDIDMVLACYDLLDEIALTFLQNMQRRGTLILKDRGLECISKNTLKRAFDDDHEV